MSVVGLPFSCCLLSYEIEMRLLERRPPNGPSPPRVSASETAFGSSAGDSLPNIAPVSVGPAASIAPPATAAGSAEGGLRSAPRRRTGVSAFYLIYGQLGWVLFIHPEGRNVQFQRKQDINRFSRICGDAGRERSAH